MKPETDQTDQSGQPSPLTRLNRATGPASAGQMQISAEQGVPELIACLTSPTPDEQPEERTASFNVYVAQLLAAESSKP